MTTYHSPAQRSLSRRQLLGLLGAGTLGGIGGLWAGSSTQAGRLNAPQPVLPNIVQSPSTSVVSASGVRLHAIQTGYVAVKAAHRLMQGPEALRFLSIVTDSRWTAWMPIMTWVIEHPSGLIVVDTGETAQALDPNYAQCDPVTGFIYAYNLRFAVTPADEIDAQMRALNLDPEAVRIVVQTHLHGDHMGRLAAFPNATFYVPRADYPSSNGTLACHYPTQFAPQFPQFAQAPLSSFGQGHALTSDGDVWIVPTPGHTVGHQSLLLLDGVNSWLFAGDTSFDEQQMREDQVGGIAADIGLARTTLAAIRAYAAEQPLIYLPSHDPETAARFSAGAPSQV